MVSKRDVADALGAGLTGVADAARFIHVGGQIQDYGANSTGQDVCVFIAPYSVKLVRFTIRVKTLETAAGTVDVEKVPSGTVIGSGTDIVTQLVPTAAGGLVAATNYNLVVATDGTEVLDEGDMLILKGGTTGELTGMAYTTMLERMV